MPSDKLIKVTNNLRDEIARREKICAAATPGPLSGRRVGNSGRLESGHGGGMCVAEVSFHRDMVFFAHARTGYPETLAALADAVAALEGARHHVDRLVPDLGGSLLRSNELPETPAAKALEIIDAALAQIAGRLESKG